MKIGYARTSTVDQEAGFEAQKKVLEQLGCEQIFSEQVSGKNTDRPQLKAMLAYVRPGDTVVVSKLDRLSRRVKDVLEIAEQLDAKGASLRIEALDINTASPSGKLMLTVLAAVAQMERDEMLERQRVGIIRAKANGKYRGRVPVARAKADDVRRLASEGHHVDDIALALSISRASVYRCLNKSSAQPGAAA